jgi:hypothetical protein
MSSMDFDCEFHQKMLSTLRDIFLHAAAVLRGAITAEPSSSEADATVIAQNAQISELLNDRAESFIKNDERDREFEREKDNNRNRQRSSETNARSLPRRKPSSVFALRRSPSQVPLSKQFPQKTALLRRRSRGFARPHQTSTERC